MRLAIALLIGCSRAETPIAAEPDTAPAIATTVPSVVAPSASVVASAPAASLSVTVSACIRNCGKSECGPDGGGGNCGDRTLKGRFFACEKEYANAWRCRDRSHCLDCKKN